VDLFCGTGAVAEQAARVGWPVLLNDHLHSAVTMAAARLIGPGNASFAKLGGYAAVVELLNQLPPTKGFIWREYTPASTRFIGFERRYFTEANGGRVDAIRGQIDQWACNGEISVSEQRLLLADLISAVNRVANIAGTYGCFLSKWQPSALSSLVIRPRELARIDAEVSVSVAEAASVRSLFDDVVYLDPPYTKRQYAAYYHLIETITVGDEPVVEGVSGLRPWRHKASDFCYKVRALGAFVSLVQGINARRVLISYSEDGHVPIDRLVSALRPLGSAVPHRLDEIARYRPNRAAQEGREAVGEYLIEFSRTPEPEYA
jgi:adenine-specific DNA-methyltransferase